MADPPPPTGGEDPLIPITERAAFLARVHLGVTIPLIAVTLIPLSARLYVRIWPIWRVGWDDFLIVLGFSAATTDFSLLLREIYLTPRYIPLSEAISAIRLAYLAIFMWGLAMTCIKTSIALTLLRIPLDHRAWRPFLYTVLAVQIIYFVADTAYIFAKCRPLPAAWDFTMLYTHPGARCPDIPTDVLVSSIGSALNVATDIALSVAPMVVLWRLRRPRRERLLVCCLTGMGLFASGASVAKAVMVGRWGKVEDMWALAMSIATWTVVEQFVALLAACSPSLKGPIEWLLGRFGVVLGQGNAAEFWNAGRKEMDGRSGPVRFFVREEEVEVKDGAGAREGNPIPGR
ncbi:hypothetical protein OQA88_10780 [Cercophora sp. LCS_1]